MRNVSFFVNFVPYVACFDKCLFTIQFKHAAYTVKLEMDQFSVTSILTALVVSTGNQPPKNNNKTMCFSEIYTGEDNWEWGQLGTNTFKST